MHLTTTNKTSREKELLRDLSCHQYPTHSIWRSEVDYLFIKVSFFFFFSPLYIFQTLFDHFFWGGGEDRLDIDVEAKLLFSLSLVNRTKAKGRCKSSEHRSGGDDGLKDRTCSNSSSVPSFIFQILFFIYTCCPHSISLTPFLPLH